MVPLSGQGDRRDGVRLHRRGGGHRRLRAGGAAERGSRSQDRADRGGRSRQRSRHRRSPAMAAAQGSAIDWGYWTVPQSARPAAAMLAARPRHRRLELPQRRQPMSRAIPATSTAGRRPCCQGWASDLLLHPLRALGARAVAYAGDAGRPIGHADGTCIRSRAATWPPPRRAVSPRPTSITARAWPARPSIR
jgi:hypothetical protein